jgi:hypothetical protein
MVCFLIPPGISQAIVFIANPSKQNSTFASHLAGTLVNFFEMVLHFVKYNFGKNPDQVFSSEDLN